MRAAGFSAEVSIHAPARGATVGTALALGLDKVSIHAPARGATLRDYAAEVQAWFQFTRPRGARLIFKRRGHAQSGVSIHAPARGATSK